MGTWGHGPFDNDDAGDWVWSLEESDDFSVLQKTLDGIVNAGGVYLESPACCEALAAAEVVAALLGRPTTELPDEVRSWIRGRAVPPGLVGLAKQAVATIKAKSELQELWQETEDYDVWSKSVVDLESRLVG